MLPPEIDFPNSNRLHLANLGQRRDALPVLDCHREFVGRLCDA